MENLFGAAIVVLPLLLQHGVNKWRKDTARNALHQFWGTMSPNEDLCETGDSVPYDRAIDDRRYIKNLSQGQTFSQEHSGIGYDDLDDKVPQMRLLRLHPPSHNDNQLFCSLQTISVSDAARTPYTALSYTWGSGADRAIIFVDNKAVEVRRNLHDALIELRRRGHAVIWNDYLCINQKDTHGERRQQLLQMHSIYGLAKTVVAWLGSSDEQTKSFVQTLQKVCRFRENIGEPSHICTGNFMQDLSQMWIKDLSAYPRLFPHVQRVRRFLNKHVLNLLDKINPDLKELALDLCDLGREFLHQIQHLVRRPYWRRAWILQELVTASSIEIWCGEDTIDYTTFTGILREMELMRLAGVPIVFTQFHEQILKLDQLKSKWQRDEPIHLLEAFQDTYYARSTRKHDEIYSILNIGYNKIRYVPVLDYQAKMESLITQMTELRIKSTKSLDLICMQSLTKSAFDLPSWAPDWRLIGKHSFNDRMTKYLTGQDEHPKINARNKQWTATSGSRCLDVEFADGGRLLRVRCYVIGSIDQLVPSATQVIDIGTRPKLPQSRINRLMTLAFSESANAIASAIFEAMTVYKEADHLEDEKCDWSVVFDSSALKQISKSKEKVYKWLMAHRGLDIGGRSLEGWSKGIQWKPEAVFHSLQRGVNRFTRHNADQGTFHMPSTPVKRSIVSAVCRIIEDDLGLVTIGDSEGIGWFGWAHPLARIGDQVCLLEGCSIPVILRDTDKDWEGKPEFEIIGDAYVAGAMAGELWPKAYRELQHVYLS